MSAQRGGELLHAPAFDLQAGGGAVAAVAAQVRVRTRSARRAGRTPRCCARTPSRSRRPARSSRRGDGGARPGARRRSRSPRDASPPPRARSRSAPPERAICASASKRMCLSTCRRSALARSSSSAISRARAGASVRISSSPASARYMRPAAFSRGASAKPTERSFTLPGSTLDTAISARSPGLAVLASARSPRRTSVRFSPTSATTSAIVASATRSRSCSSSRIVAAAAGGQRQRLRELVGDRGRAQLRARIAAQQRMHDRSLGQHAVRARRMVVGDHHLHSQRPAPRPPPRQR